MQESGTWSWSRSQKKRNGRQQPVIGQGAGGPIGRSVGQITYSSPPISSLHAQQHQQQHQPLAFYTPLPIPAPNGPFQTFQNMPPLKRPRVEPKHRQQRDHTNHNHSSKRTFSDFRLHRIVIGNFISEEVRQDSDTRDSRIRFYFRNANDRDPPSSMSFIEAAAQEPDRVSISVWKGTKRIIVPASTMHCVSFTRATGRIVLKTDGYAVFESLVHEASCSIAALTLTSTLTPTLKAGNGNGGGPSPAQFVRTTDITGGELSRSKVIEIWLDLEKPLTEPKWTRGNLKDNIDSGSRFRSILEVTDADPPATLDSIMYLWTDDDPHRSLFLTYELSQPLRILEILSRLLKKESVLTSSIHGVINLVQSLLATSTLSTPEFTEMLKPVIFGIPEYMITKSLDAMFATWIQASGPVLLVRSLQAQAAFLPALPGQGQGEKRQRMESEVPSERVAAVTLEEPEKRPRLTSNSDACLHSRSASEHALDPPPDSEKLTASLQLLKQEGAPKPTSIPISTPMSTPIQSPASTSAPSAMPIPSSNRIHLNSKGTTNLSQSWPNLHHHTDNHNHNHNHNHTHTHTHTQNHNEEHDHDHDHDQRHEYHRDLTSKQERNHPDHRKHDEDRDAEESVMIGPTRPKSAESNLVKPLSFKD